MRKDGRRGQFATKEPGCQGVDTIGNAFFTFSYAALSGDGPSDPVLKNAVEKAVCMMKAFPAQKYERPIPAGAQKAFCINRLDVPCAAEPIPLSEYAFDNYLWRLDSFEIQKERPEDR